MINQTMPVSLMMLTIFLTTERRTHFDMIRIANEARPFPFGEEAELGVDVEGSERFLIDEVLTDKIWAR
jgi:hypothetical protein